MTEIKRTILISINLNVQCSTRVNQLKTFCKRIILINESYIHYTLDNFQIKQIACLCSDWKIVNVFVHFKYNMFSDAISFMFYSLFPIDVTIHLYEILLIIFIILDENLINLSPWYNLSLANKAWNSANVRKTRPIW